MNWEWIGRPGASAASSRDVEWMRARRWLLHFPAGLTGWLARKRRQLGWYDMLTLWMFRSAWIRLQTPAEYLAYLSFRRDLGFELKPAIARRVEALQYRLPHELQTTVDGLLPGPADAHRNEHTTRNLTALDEQQATLNLLEDAIRSAVRGAGISVVGNSPSIEGLRLGATIDKAQLVVRFNACFGPNSHLTDTGSRTDIWVRSPAFVGSSPGDASWQIVSGPRFFSSLGLLGERIDSCNIPLTVWRELVRQLRAPPSAGLLVLFWAHQICSGWSGISVAAIGMGRGKHHHERRRGRTMFRHDWRAEEQLLQRWVSDGLVQLDAKKNAREVVLATSFRLCRTRNLKQLIGSEIIYRPVGLALSRAAAVLTWGKTPGELRATMIAKRSGLPVWRLEDGFLRSVELGSKEPPLSIVIDDLGIYYDAARPSRLEAFICQPLSAQQSERVAALILGWRTGRVSKYNHLREYSGELPARYVLVADQTWGDASIRFGSANSDSFERMLRAALDENPACEILVKTHPDVFTGRKRGHFSQLQLANQRRVRVLAQDVHPVRLLEHAEAIYTVTSQIGFEGLLWGKRVRTFGMPFYAGWGLTEDTLAPPARRKPVALDQVVHAALIDYPVYVDPESGERCEPERVMAWMSLQRGMRERFPEVVYGVGFSMWKRPLVRDFLQGSEVRFVAEANHTHGAAALAVWGRAPLPSIPAGASLIRMEDGFLRSVGLGADLVRPLSWVQDQSGIYYDPTQPSDLELLLERMVFDDSLLARARTLRQSLLQSGLTKYNLAGAIWKRPEGLGSRRVLLVPGQVESDASIRWGGTTITSNEGLLSHVRKVNPHAYVVYKPHPDVLAGLRRGQSGGREALLWCDEVVLDVSMGELLTEVDEVHTITSLAGFEGLMRGKKVSCYGLPFYAGWGLTHDLQVFPDRRRTRRLALDELVAGVLLAYPTYVSFATRRFTTAEQTLAELVNLRKNNKQSVTNRIFRAVVRGGLVLRARLSKK